MAGDWVDPGGRGRGGEEGVDWSHIGVGLAWTSGVSVWPGLEFQAGLGHKHELEVWELRAQR